MVADLRLPLFPRFCRPDTGIIDINLWEPYTKYQPKKNIQKQWIRNLEQLRNCKTLKTTKTAANGQLCRLEIGFDLQCELPLLTLSAASARGELRLQFHLQKEQPWASAVQVLGKLIFPKTRQLDSVQT